MMGWAIQRADGTYRAWNRNAQDDLLQAGETWVQLDIVPPIIIPARPEIGSDTAKLRLKTLDPKHTTLEELVSILHEIEF